MTKSKRRTHRYPTARTAAAAHEETERSLSAPLDLKDYVLLNIVFDGFCGLQLAVLSVLMDEMPGLVFFFVFIMLGFLLVSIFDYLACRLVTDDAAVPEATNTQGDAV